MEYNFENLLLLAGTNPLPNYVVAWYFLNINKTLKGIYIIHSEQTLKQAKNLKELLRRKYPNKNFELIPVEDVSRADILEKNITTHLQSLQGSSVHLNYTGGTKPMGIHIYRTIEKKFSQTSFSYLDARTFRIIDDEKGFVEGDLRGKVIMNLQDILELHGFEVKKDHSKNIFNSAVNIFKELIEKNRLLDFYNVYDRKIFLTNEKSTEKKETRLIKKKKARLIKKKKEITEALRKSKAEEPLLSIVLSLPEEKRIYDKEGNFIEPSSDQDLKETIEFLDGKWLEQYVYSILSTARNLKYTEIKLECNVKKPEWNKDFEIDLIILQGYQLIGISCTTENMQRLCKTKGFEIYHRVRQIGGEEARAILITRLPCSQKDLVQEELSIDTGGKENILVLGEDDLKSESLIHKIQNFIK
ncbi:MAG: Card1-like endonuclease domain-containing protein [Thermodesulfovibrionales bacterium]